METHAKSNDAITFFNFRDEIVEKRRKQQEMKLEYEKYKMIEEERFRNRFADKKIGNVQQSSDGILPAVPRNDVLVSSKPVGTNPDDYMNILLKKIDDLQEAVNSLKSFKSPMESDDDKIGRAPFTPNYLDSSIRNERNFDNRMDSASRDNIVNDAEKRLHDLESIIRSLKCSDNLDQVDNKRVDDSREKSDDASGHVPDLLRESAIRRGRFLNLYGSSHSRERLKKLEKNNYAKELQQQIEERQRLRELQRKKSIEEEQRKVAEMQTYDQLGQKIRDNVPNLVEKSETETPNFTRGGNGIFGEPLTEKQKQANAKYREQLIQQMEERKRREEELKQKEKEEDMVAARQVAEDIKNMEARETVREKPNHFPELKEASEVFSKTKDAETNIRKRSICLQTTLGQKSLSQKPKPIKVVRNSIPKTSAGGRIKSAELLLQINQIKLELAAEKLRIRESGSLPEQYVQVYDPRFAYLPISATGFFENQYMSRPNKVYQDFAPVRRTNCMQYAKPKALTGIDFGSEPQPGCTFNKSNSLNSISTFLPHDVVALPRSPSVGSLNLDKINLLNQQRLNRFDSHVDLYKNEEPIIQEFMAQEEFRNT